MFRPAALFSLILLASPVAAGGPPIAYSKGSTTSELYLANTDGSGARLLYKAPRSKKIFNLAMRPGGNEIAFEEIDCCSYDRKTTLMIVAYKDDGTRDGTPVSIPLDCRISSLDYHPSDRTLLFAGGCDHRLSVLNVTTKTWSNIATGRKVSKANWMSGSRVFIAASPSLYTFDVAAPTVLTKVADQDAVVTVDASADGSRGVISVANYPTAIKLVSKLGEGASLSTLVSGNSPVFSPDATQMAYIATDNRGGETVRVRQVGGTAETTIAARSSYASVTWANTVPVSTASSTDFGVRTVP